MRYLLGIDLGTSSVKSLLMDEQGGIVGTAQRGYDIKKTRQDYAEQDMEELWEAARETLRELTDTYPAEAGLIGGIGFSGQMHGLVMVDKEGKPVRDAIIWADQRSGKEIEEMYKVTGMEAYRGTIYNSLSTGFLAASLMWVRQQEPENFRRTVKVMLPKDYIRYKMCGCFGTDMSDASGTGIFDTGSRQWAWELMGKLGLPKNIFPDCHDSCEAAGEVTDWCQRETGLKKGTPVVYGGGDTPVQAVGNGMIKPGILSSNIGTACQTATILDRPIHDRAYRTNTFSHCAKDTWMLMGANLSGGVALKWLRDSVLCMDSYEEMDALAGTVPAGSEGLLFLPYLNGERTPWNDPDAKGIYLGLTLKHTRAHMIRSAMEGIVFGMKNSLEIFKEMGIEYRKIIASGGGARGQTFLQIQADIFGKEIYVNQGEEQACIGAAILAGVGVGIYSDMEEACEKVVHMREETIIPNGENHKIYEQRFRVFKEIYGRNKDLFVMN